MQGLQHEHFWAQDLGDDADVSVDEAPVFVQVAGQPHSHAHLQAENPGLGCWVPHDPLEIVDPRSCFWELGTQPLQVQCLGAPVGDCEESELPSGPLFDLPGSLDSLLRILREPSPTEKILQGAPGRLVNPGMGQELKHGRVCGPGGRVLLQFDFVETSGLLFSAQVLVQDVLPVDGLQLLEIPHKDHERAWAQLRQGNLEALPHFGVDLAHFVQDDQIILPETARRVVLLVLFSGDLKGRVDGLNGDQVARRESEPHRIRFHCFWQTGFKVIYV